MSQQETFLFEEPTNTNDPDTNIPSEQILIDYDRDSDDGFSVVKKNKFKSNKRTIECINDTLETILSIPRFPISFTDYIKSHTNLLTDLLKTNVTTTNNISNNWK